MYRIALCDDDPAFLSSFQARLAQAFAEKGVGCDVSLFDDTDTLLARFEEADAFDLVCLDIVFEGQTGIEAAKRIREISQRVDILLITVEPGYAVDGYDVAPLHFLVKPVTSEKLDQAINRFLAKRSGERLLIKNKGELLTIFTDDILYMEIFSHEIWIHTRAGQPISYTGTLMELAEVLPSRSFVRCHKSFLISLRHVSGISRYQVRLADGRALPIGKSRYNQILSDFVAFTQNRLADY